ncbi:RND efflux system, inner membrane transporter CmeB [Burkholderia singularis]|uniref:RND efflux system, inner membrane transporter CmeB n=1 Tax=Burkholderia singularis TaxID=1503053 RepID=A0A238HCB0_9BURK|nr:RND efflux system, inner membrane transporter CmeB [Burkholderia singularis]
MARSAKGRAAQFDCRRRREGDSRSERAGRGGRDRRIADAAGHAAAIVGERARAVADRRGVRRHRREDRAGWRRHAFARYRADRSRCVRVRAAFAAGQQAGRRDRDQSVAGCELVADLRRSAQDDGRAEAGFSGRRRLPDRLRSDTVRAFVDQGGCPYAARSDRARRDRRDRVPADVARVDHSADRRAGVDRRHVLAAAAVRLLDQCAVVVRDGVGDRDRRRRCDRGRRERRAEHRERTVRARGDVSRNARSERADHRDRVDARGGVRAARVHVGPDGSVLQTVRDDDRDLHGDLGIQLADAVARAVGDSAERARRQGRLAHARDEPRARRFLPGLQQGVPSRRTELWAWRARRAVEKGGDARRVSRAGRRYRDGVADRAGRLRTRAGQGIPDRVRAVAQWRIARSHREGDSPDGRDCAEAAWRRERGFVPGAVGKRLHEQLERGHRVRHAQAVRRAAWQRAVGRRDRGGAESAIREHQGFVRCGVPAAAGARSRHTWRLQDANRGPRLGRLREARGCDQRFHQARAASA